MSIFLMMMAVFLVFVFLGIPVSFSIGLSTVAAVLAKGMPLAFVSQMAFTGLDSYTYLAIPMFILAGYLMETGGLSKRLVNFAASLVGNIHGGLGIITVLACAFFAAISIPPQQGTSIRVIVTDLMSLFLIISVNFSE